MMANPFDYEVQAQLIMESLPKDFRVKVQDRQITFGQAFKLDPNEIRVVTLQFTPPKDLEKRPPEGDVVVHISLKIAEEILGGFSARLFAANVCF